MKVLSFTARIYKLGINPCVDVPAEAANFFKRRGFVPIVGLVDGKTYRATLVPRGQGLHRLYLNEPIRRATRTDVGSRVRFELKLDRKSRVIKTPPDFAAALKAHPPAHNAFRQATASRRRELLRWITGAKRPETRRSRIQRTIASLACSK